MPRYRVYLEASASLTVTVDVPEDPDGDEYMEREAAIEAAMEEASPGLCLQCSGYSQPWSLDIGDFEPWSDNPVEKVKD